MFFRDYCLPETKGNTLYAAAAKEGLPPIVTLATQLSTRLWGNIVAFRGSGPIPQDLYYDVLTGKAKPKPVTLKIKTSNIGPQAGRIVKDVRNGGYKLKNAEYELRTKVPSLKFKSSSLKISLRGIYHDILSRKYALLTSDDQYLLKFNQINFDSDVVKGITYSINLKTAEPIPKKVLLNYNLVSSLPYDLTQNNFEDQVFNRFNLDALYIVSVKHMDNKESSPIKVLDGYVRDSDIDFITDPSSAKLISLLDTKYFEKFLTPLDMSPKNKYLRHRANNAAVELIASLVEINNLRWGVYNIKKDKAKLKNYDSFNEDQWELENIEIKPIVPENATLGLMSNMVVTVGKGTPTQSYQALEINIYQQKILAYFKNPKERFKLIDFENNEKYTLLKLHQQIIKYNKLTRSKCFIQHPAECHNEHYTSSRSPSIIIQGDTVIVSKDDATSAKIVRNTQGYIPINPKWVSESPGNQYAEIWVEHYLRNTNMYIKENNIRTNCSMYLKQNIGFLRILQNKIKESPDDKGAKSIRKHLNYFFKNHPEVLQEVTGCKITKAIHQNRPIGITH